MGNIGLDEPDINMTDQIVVCWSGGKDSSLALDELQSSGRYEIVSLLTTVTDGYDCISHHGVRRSLLRQQAAVLDLPLHGEQQHVIQTRETQRWLPELIGTIELSVIADRFDLQQQISRLVLLSVGGGRHAATRKDLRNQCIVMPPVIDSASR